MSALSSFYFNSQASIVQLECMEISHPNFSKTYRLVRNMAAGVNVTHEDSQGAHYDYYPMRITSQGVRDNLDVGLQVDWGDLGEVLPAELDAVATANGFGTKPTLKYRTYRSDILNSPMYGPLTLQITRINHNDEGATFEAHAPKLNNSKTGELFDLDRFAMLRGFL